MRAVSELYDSTKSLEQNVKQTCHYVCYMKDSNKCKAALGLGNRESKTSRVNIRLCAK